MTGDQRWQILEAMPDAVLLTRSDGRIAYANSQAEELFGYTRDELRQQNIERLLPVESRRRHVDHRAGYIASPAVKAMGTRTELRALHKDGSELPVEISLSPLQADGELLVVSCVRNIAERKRAEKALRDSRADYARDAAQHRRAERTWQLAHRFLEIANSHTQMAPLLEEFTAEVERATGCAGIGVRILDEAGNIPYQVVRGFSQEFFERESALSVKRDRCMCINVIQGAADPSLPFYTAGGSFYMNGTTCFLATVSEEEKGQTRNACNEFGYESVALVPIRAGKKIVGLVHIADPNENAVPLEVVEALERAALKLGTAIHRVLAEEALRKARDELEQRVHERTAELSHVNEQLANAQRIARLGFWDWNVQDDYLYWSDEIYEIFGLDPQEFDATYEAFLRAVHPDDRQLVQAQVEACLRDDTEYFLDHRIVLPNGQVRHVHEQGEVARDAMGRPAHLLGTVIDISELKSTENRLRETLDELEGLKERLRAENVYLQDEIKSAHDFEEIVGQSEELRLTLRKIEHVADTDANVLLLGETGTGKELLARAIHNRSRRKERPLVKVNCAALPLSLIESELFGHIKGAFTGALADKQGRFELANGGTIFLDEIGDLDLDLQTKLLRVLQEGEFEKIGATQTIQVDVRVIAATNRDLHEAMREGSFRPDLYYRLAVFPLEVPPLRLRRTDIPLLVWHFITKHRARLGKTIDSIPTAAMSALVAYDWPGNVRELENVIERAMILSPGPALMLDESFAQPARLQPIAGTSSQLQEIDRAHIVSILEECRWKVKGPGNAADRLGLKPSTLRYRMKKLGVCRPSSMPE